MTRKRNKAAEEIQRQSRKEILRARKEREQTKQIRLAAAGVGALLALVLVIAIVNEFFIVPGRAVATVNGEDIALREWQGRVRYERAQRILILESQLELVSGDVGVIQQYAGQMISELMDAELMGQNVLDRMVDELIVRQEAEARGITVTDADVDEAIQDTFNYFHGQSPTPFPTPTETVVPTPSLTPIPTPVITETVPTATVFPTRTPGPTSTPRPTATPVSLKSFQEQVDELLSQYSDLGVDEATYRAVIRMQLYQERLMDALAQENHLSAEAEHVSIFILSFDTEEEANEAIAMIQEDDFLTVWNSIRSLPFDPESESTAVASEVLWRTQDALEQSLGVEAAGAAFTLPLNAPSIPAIERVAEDGAVRYYILQVSGREVRELTDSVLLNAKREMLASFIDEQADDDVQLTEAWRGRAPTQPVLDPKFLTQPTPAPLQLTPVGESPGDDS